nr:hypothetical protein [uncultured Campylobacter sp.]
MLAGRLNLGVNRGDKIRKTSVKFCAQSRVKSGVKLDERRDG